jgi:hypothetical protein
MRPFSVPIRTDDPEVVADALRAAGMKQQTDHATKVAEDHSVTAVSVTVVFEAADEASAEARVRDAIGDTGEVGPAKRAGSEAT